MNTYKCVYIILYILGTYIVDSLNQVERIEESEGEMERNGSEPFTEGMKKILYYYTSIDNKIN